ncbi:hypothetical protein ACQP2K_24950 [Microbispora siamensis]
MNEFINSLARGHDAIRQETGAIRRILTSVNVSAAGLNPVGEVLAWLETELPQLRRRRAAILASEKAPLRYCLWHLPARLVCHARRRILKISATWPWKNAFLICWQRLSALAAPT